LTCGGCAVKLASRVGDGDDGLQQSSQIWYGARSLADWIRAGGPPRRPVRALGWRLRWHAHWFEQNWQAQAQRLQGLEPPRMPAFILGLWRSGTTVLHELLTACTGWSTPRTWQCFHPSTCFLTGPPAAEARVERPMDAGLISTHGPQEDEFALLLLGEPSLYRGFIDPRRLAECAAGLGDAVALASPQTLPRWQLFVRGVAAQSEQRRLLLKSPNHSLRLPLLQAQFPDARFVWIGRHSGEVLASNLRMWRSMSDLYGLWDCPAGTLETFLRAALRACTRALERALQELTRERLCWVDFEQLHADPRGTLQRVLEFLAAGQTAAQEDAGETVAGPPWAARIEQALARIPIHAGERAALPQDDEVARLERLMASARARFGAGGGSGRGPAAP
jgi:omega-hydroxy-beta-dihydromenaquinone-9 sulfotransferase